MVNVSQNLVNFSEKPNFLGYFCNFASDLK